MKKSVLKLKQIIYRVLYKITKKESILLKINEINTFLYKMRNIHIGKNSVIYNTVFSSLSR